MFLALFTVLKQSLVVIQYFGLLLLDLRVTRECINWNGEASDELGVGWRQALMVIMTENAPRCECGGARRAIRELLQVSLECVATPRVLGTRKTSRG